MSASFKSKKHKNSSVDAKLLHLVRKLLMSGNMHTIECDDLVALLRAQHREYQRKDEHLLHVAVQEAMQQIRSNEQYQTDDNDNEKEYDRAAAIHDVTVSTSNGLNASLRQRYQQQAASESVRRNSSQQVTTDTNDVTKNSSTTIAKKRRRVLKSRIGNDSSGTMSSDFDATTSWLVPNRPTERYTDLGGLSATVQTVRQLVEYPITRPELYRHLGVDPPRGVLLRGPPGT